MIFVKLTEAGVPRVLYGTVGLTFIVDHFTEGGAGTRVAHVRDYRFPTEHKDHQIWSIGEDGYEVISKD